MKRLLLLAALITSIFAGFAVNASALTTVPTPCAVSVCDYSLIRVDGNICPPSTCQLIVRYDNSGGVAIVGNAGTITYTAQCALLVGQGFFCGYPTFSANSYTGVWDNYTGHFTAWARKSCGNGLYRFSAQNGFGVDGASYPYPAFIPLNITSACRSSI